MNRTSFIDKNMSIGKLIITLLMIMIAVVGGTLAWITYSSGVFSEVEISKGNNDLTFFTLFYNINELDSILIDKGLSYTIVNTKGTTNTGDDVSKREGSEYVELLDMFQIDRDVFGYIY